MVVGEAFSVTFQSYLRVNLSQNRLLQKKQNSPTTRQAQRSCVKVGLIVLRLPNVYLSDCYARDIACCWPRDIALKICVDDLRKLSASVAP